MISEKIFKQRVRSGVAQFVYGATDGTVTTFAVVAGSAGGGLSAKAALILGFANLVADGISMGISTYLSEETSEQVRQAKRSRKLSDALITFFSFLVVGSIPLLAYIYHFVSESAGDRLFLMSSILAASSFVLIGLIRARVTSRSYLLSVIETCMLGGIAALAAYSVGNIIERLIV